MKPTADQLCVPNQPCKSQQEAGCSDPDRKQGPALGQLQQPGIHQLPQHGTASPQPDSPPQHPCPSGIQCPKAAHNHFTKTLGFFPFSLLSLDYQDQHKPEEEGRLQTRQLLRRQPQPPRVPAKLSPCPSAGDLPTQGQSGIRAAANICLSALYSGVRARARAGVWFPAG